MACGSGSCFRRRRTFAAAARGTRTPPYREPAVQRGRTLALGVIALCLAAAAGGIRALSPGRSESDFRLDLADSRIVGGGWFGPKPVMLTFDDGPANAAVDRSILATLSRHHARALWFVTCARLDPALDPMAAENRATLRQIVAEGHLLGNHGYSHVDLAALGRAAPSRLAQEVGGCSAAIRAASGVVPAYFRPPWGRNSPGVRSAAAAAGMGVLLWSGNSFDSLLASFKRRPETFLSFVARHPAFDIAANADAGEVLLMHDYPNTALALDDILTRLEKRGFRFVLPSKQSPPAPGDASPAPGSGRG